MHWIYPATAVAYVAFAAAWVFMEVRKVRGRFIVGALAMVLAAPFFVSVGVFLGSFSSNLCYSDVIGTLVDHPLKSGVRNQLPLHGYETSCEEVRAAVEKLR
jgi:hypothetical protein